MPRGGVKVLAQEGGQTSCPVTQKSRELYKELIQGQKELKESVDATQAQPSPGSPEAAPPKEPSNFDKLV